MSIDIFRQRILTRIDELKDETLTQVVNVRHSPRAQSEAGVIFPATSAEEIAFRVIDLNSRARALDVAKNIITEEWTLLLNPQQEDDPKDKKKSERTETIY